MPQNLISLDDVAAVLPGGTDLADPSNPNYPLKPLTGAAPAVNPPATPTISLDDVASVTPAPASPTITLSDVATVASNPTTPSTTPAPHVYTLDEFRAKPAEVLDQDKEFLPVEFGKQNLEAIRSDPALLKKLTDVYRARETRGTSVKEKLSAFSNVGGVVKTLGEGVKSAAKAGLALSPQGIAANPEQAVKTGAELVSSVELAGLNTADLLRRSARSVGEGLARIPGVSEVTGLKSKEAKSSAEWQSRFFDDVAASEQSATAGKGNAAVATALGVDADSLKQRGVVLNPEEIEKLSVVTDPVNYIPMGATVGAVGKIGGKLGRMAIASTVSAEQAANLAKILNTARDVASTGAKVTGAVTGATAKAAGSVLEATGNVAEKGVRAVGGTASGLGLGGLIGRDVYSALGGAAVAKGGPKLLQVAGRGLKAGGEILTGERAVGEGLALAGETLKAGATGAVKGAAEGALISLPFEIGARPEEEESILGGAGLGAVARGTLEGAAPGVRAAGRAAQNKLAESIFQRVTQSEIPESTAYGTEPGLDTVHSASYSQLAGPEKNLVNWGRELLRESGGEVYVLSGDEFKKATGSESGLGYAVRIGEKLNPDGTATPLVRIFLNQSAEALPHEFFHALETIDPAKAKDFVKSVDQSLTPQQKKDFQALYNSRLNEGRPESQWTRRITGDEVSSEVAAETFSRLFLAQDLTGVDPKVTQKAALFTSAILDKLGAPLGGAGLERGNAGVSNLGVRPQVETVKAGQAWLKNLIESVNETGTLGKPPERTRAFQGLTPADITDTTPISTKPETIPFKKPIKVEVRKKQPAPTPPPAETLPPAVTPPTTPVTPTTAPSVRTSRASQNDFAAKRAEVTNVDLARSAAEKTGDANIVARVNELSALMESGSPVVEIEHSGVKSEGQNAGRTQRRTEQEAAYIAEGMGAAPESIRQAYQKVFVPVRWEIVAGKPQLLAMSLDKVIANTHRAVKDAAAHGVADKIPYEVVDGKLTDNAWGQVVDDLQSYAANQQNGYRGDGKKLTRPTTDIGLSIPAENPAYNPAVITEDRANFLNLVQGLNPPLTARVGAQSSTITPGNIKGAVLAEINKRKPQPPAVIRPQDIGKQEFTGTGRSIVETNPLRNELSAAGVPVRELIEVTERIRAQDVNSVKARPELNFQAPVTDTIRGGFLPGEQTDTALRNGLLPDPKPAEPKPSEAVRTVAEHYASSAGIKYTPNTEYLPVNESLAKHLADFYDEAKSSPDDPAVKASYQALADETMAQYKAMTDAGYVIEPFTGEGEPYKSSSEAVADARDNKHLFFLKTEGNFSGNESNPLLRPSGVEINGQPLLVNDVFRGVHDFFGHAKEGYQFGPRGEFNAWKSHSEMFSPEAQGALAAETLAQNSWVNFGKHLRDESGNVAKKGEPGFVPLTERPFAEQKNVVVPESLIAEAKGEGKFLPTSEAIDQVQKSSPEEFIQMTRGWDGGLTKQAYRVGLDAATPEEVSALKAAQESASADRKAQMAARDINAASSSASKAQFFREAYEAATDTGSAAEPIGWRRSFPDREAPFPANKPAAAPEGKFSPGKREFDWVDFGEALDSENLPPAMRGKPARISISDALKGAKSLDFRSNGSYHDAQTHLQLLPDSSGTWPATESGLRAAYKAARDFETEVFDLSRDSGEGKFMVSGEEWERRMAREKVNPKDIKKASKTATAKEQNPTAWILPNGEVKPLTASYHEVDLSENAKEYNKRFGTAFTGKRELNDRLKALDKGFVRMRYTPNDGKMNVEVNVDKWSSQRSAVRKALDAQAEKIDRLRITLLDSKGEIIDSVEDTNLFRSENKTDAIQDAINELRPTTARPARGMSEIQRIRSLPGDFLPADNFSDKLDPIVSPAIKTEKGAIFTGPMHPMIQEAHNLDPLFSTDGFITRSGKFLNRDEAYEHALKIKQLSKQDYDAEAQSPNPWLESQAFKKTAKFLPGDELLDLGLPSEEKMVQARIKDRVSTRKEKFPEAIPAKYVKDDSGNFVVDEEGKAKPQTIEYDLANSPLAKEVAKGLRGEELRKEALSTALGDKLEKAYKTAVTNPEIKAGATWYSTARTRLKKLFGDDSKFFAELLGATSARTPVDINFRFALDAYNQFKAGAFDETIKKYREGKAKWDAGDVSDFLEATGAENPTRGQFLDWWVKENDLTPTQSNGKKFGANSRSVLRVLDGSWADEVQGPKTPNFAGNLSGATFEATIDVWAARLLHRLANEGTDKRWRILPENETGVTDQDFFIGQDAYRKAAKKIGIKPDALQAVLWFLEKDYWEKKGWTRGAGAEKSDFNTLLAKTERKPTGQLEIKRPQTELAFDLGSGDIQKRK